MNTASLNFPNSARWIWLPESDFPTCQKAPVSWYAETAGYQYGVACFRREFELPEGSGPYRAVITGDCKYRIFINDRIVGDGPPEIGGDYNNIEAPDWFFYEVRDVTAWLKPGRNRILAEVSLQGDAQCDYSCGHGGFRFALVAGEAPILNSDSTWECMLDTGWRRRGDYLPESPELPVRWYPAQELTAELAARWKLRESPLPPLAERPVFPAELMVPFDAGRIENVDAFLRRQGPLRLRRGAPLTFTLRFPEQLAGHLEFEFESTPGARFAFKYQERPGQTHATENYWSQGGHQAFRFRALQTALYLEITVAFATFGYEGYDDVLLHRLAVINRSFPVGATARFDCSDPKLLPIRNLCERTLRLCMQRLYLDSPLHQEGLGCVGDYRIEALMSYYLFGEYRLARQDLVRIALLLRQKRGRMFHTSFSLIFILMLRDYLLFSGDLAFGTEPEIVEAVDLVLANIRHYLGPEGVISEAPNYMFIDWVMFRGYNLHHPSAADGMACLTAFYAMALQADADMAAWLNQPARHRERREEWKKVRSAFNRLFWSEERGAYLNGIPGLTRIKPFGFLPPDPAEPGITPHVGVLAITARLVPPDRAERMVSGLAAAAVQHRMQPYFVDFLFDALRQSGAYDRSGLELLHLWDVLLQEHPESLKESWETGDYCHAWSGTPAIQLSRRILGVEPLTPGFVRCSIAPCRCGLQSASGEIPTPHGSIKVEWNIRSDSDFDLAVELPSGITAEIRLPEGGCHRLRVKIGRAHV